MIHKNFLIIFCLIFVSACSTATISVMPGENGVVKLISRDTEQHSSEAEAVKAAKRFCVDHNFKYITFLGNNTTYTGKMDEATRNAIKGASEGAMILDSPANHHNYNYRHTGTSPLGMLGGAGVIGHSMTNDKDYMTELSFKCANQP